MRVVTLALFSVVLAAVVILVAGKPRGATQPAQAAQVAQVAPIMQAAPLADRGVPVAPAPVAAQPPPSPAPAAPAPAVVVPETEIERSGAVVVMEPGNVAPAATATATAPPAFGVDPQIPRAQGGMAGWGPPPAPELDPRPFSEAHWQGLELIPKTPALATTLRLPADTDGVIVDDVSLPADLQGFQAGDLVTSIDATPTPNLTAFVRAADQVRDRRQVEVEVWRGGSTRRLVLTSLFERLGTANGETPTMIAPGARSPHRYQGACTTCHRIGTTGSLLTDQGDTPPNSPPTIQATASAPHRDRGPCSTCHKIVP